MCHFQESDNSLEDRDLTHCHERLKKVVLLKYSEGIQVPRENYMELKWQLEHSIQQCFVLACEKNSESMVNTYVLPNYDV